LADVFCELGAETAYNLDGGGSATMIFNGKLINTPYTNWNKPSGERRVSDIVYIGY
jgi:exopolysaccharide biosynthesis protein